MQNYWKFLLLLLSHEVMPHSLWPHGLWHARPLCPLLSPWVCSNSCPLSQWCYLTISSSAAPFSFCFQSFPASGSLPMNQLFILGGQSMGVSISVLPMTLLGWFPNWPIWSPCSPRDSQEISPAPQLESINSLVLSLLYGPTITSIHDYWKNSFDCMDLYCQSSVFAF